MSQDPEVPDGEHDLKHAVDHAAHLLPAQGPIGVFIHHNTLHAFQHLSFHEAIAAASAEFETETYLRESEYRACFERGRIDASDLDAAVEEHLEGREAADPPISLAEILRIALRFPIGVESEASLQWKIDEAGALDAFREELDARTRGTMIADGVRWLRDPERQQQVEDPPPVPLADAPESWVLRSLWSACKGIASRRSRETPSALADRVPSERSHRDLLRALTGRDPAALVNPLMIRFCAAYLDQGQASWPMPEREHGFLTAFHRVVRNGSILMPPALARVPSVVADQARRGAKPDEIVREALEALGVPSSAWGAYLTRVLLQLPGWAGMVRRIEANPSECPHDAAVPTLMEYLAARLTCDREALAYFAQDELEYTGSLAGLPAHVRSLDVRDRPDRPATLEAAFRLFQLCQLAGVGVEEAWQMSKAERRAIVDALDDLDETTRRRIWHEAYERHHRHEVLSALHAAREKNLATLAKPKRKKPAFQVWFCIDDREESVRRHLEEVEPEVETFGIAGFFGLAIEYVPLDGSHTSRLCPAVVTPSHSVREVPVESDSDRAARWRRSRTLMARAEKGLGHASRSLLRGSLLTSLLGLFATFPMVVRLLFPRLAESLRDTATRLLAPLPRTRLTSTREEERAEEDAGEAHGSLPPKPIGFTLREQIDRIAAGLENIGLVKDFSPLIVVLGHGSVSLNNPHESAHDCGACGGKHGGPNARLFAQIANRPEVRAGLHERGIQIPDSTIFVGGMHNTCNDALDLYDVDAIPESHVEVFARAKESLDAARAWDAHERCRRFENVPRSISKEGALRHVQGRAGDLSQVRPEYGHATNAVCHVGRRELTRGLFLDRRAFLVSYDPSIDTGGRILERILAAVGPVGAGISLEYYFSVVDNDRYGCGTKLPHNIAAMVGVMDGHASDLRTGLPWQMVEIHEPVRLLLVCEATPDTLLAIAGRQPEVRELVVNGWVQLVSQDPESGRMQVFRPSKGAFVPFEPDDRPLPVARSSAKWYRGKEGFVPPALIDPSARKRKRTARGTPVHAAVG